MYVRTHQLLVHEQKSIDFLGLEKHSDVRRTEDRLFVFSFCRRNQIPNAYSGYECIGVLTERDNETSTKIVRFRPNNPGRFSVVHRTCSRRFGIVSGQNAK